eukprot:663754-Pleurochrysis_carterae.AAC.1
MQPYALTHARATFRHTQTLRHECHAIAVSRRRARPFALAVRMHGRHSHHESVGAESEHDSGRVIQTCRYATTGAFVRYQSTIPIVLFKVAVIRKTRRCPSSTC